MKVFISKEPYILFYCLIVIIISCMMGMYTFPEALDIIRYYEDAENYSKIYDLQSYYKLISETNFDFIYTCSLFTFAKYGIPLNFLTIIYISIYYIAMCEIIRKVEPVKIPGLILLLILLFAPFVWVQAISRNLAAISFYYLGILLWLNKKHIFSVLVFLISIFTHISMALWLLLSIMALVLSKVSLTPKKKNLLFISSVIIGLFFPMLMFDLFLSLAGLGDSRYASYAQLSMSSALFNPYLGHGEYVPMLFTLLFSIYLVTISKNNDFFFWMLFLLTVGLCFAIMTSTMLTNRIIMLMPLFIGCNVCAALKENNKVVYPHLYLWAIVGFCSNFIHFWYYRDILFS